MAQRTASKPILSLRSLFEACGKDFFNNGMASAQCPVSASFAPWSATADESGVVVAFLATCACVAVAINARRKPARIVPKRSLIKQKEGRPCSCLPSNCTLALGLVVELQCELNVAFAL